METHPHFESPRGQENIARAIVALNERAERLAYQSKIQPALDMAAQLERERAEQRAALASGKECVK